jgi:DNA-binding NtrC family response regulator
MVAKTDYTVLIRGESGTGKEIAATMIHKLSPRRDKPFVMVNCPAIPENLLESELFGHRRGAFTGADSDHQGLFVQADGGTICLDEIGDIPEGIQTKLLRVLQDKKIKILGSDRARPVDVRILASTNRNLEEKIAEHSFREDFFYRLNVVGIHTPSLEEIVEDIALIADHFLRQACAELGCPPKTLSLAAAEQLTRQRWPGNARQLQNVIRRAAMFCPDEVIGTQHLGTIGQTEERGQTEAPIKIEPYKTAKRTWVDSFTERYVTELLRQTSGNISRAALLSGLTRAALQRILKRHDIDGSSFKGKQVK